MTPAGLAAVEAAKADGRWESAYASFRDAIPPADFLKELSKNEKAEAFFKTLNKANVECPLYEPHPTLTAWDFGVSSDPATSRIVG